jgi:hypothetical protein
MLLQGLGYSDPVDLEWIQGHSRGQAYQVGGTTSSRRQGGLERERNLGLYSYRAGVIYMYMQCNPTIDALSHSLCELERSAEKQ